MENMKEYVRVRKGDMWKYYKIVNKASTPKSYSVRPPLCTCHSRNYKRNIRKSKELYYVFELNIKTPSGIDHMNTSLSPDTVSTGRVPVGQIDV